jgi:hypothetical protein
MRWLADFSGWSRLLRVVVALDGPDSSLDVPGSSCLGCPGFLAGLASFAFSGWNSGFVELLALADFFFFSGGAVSSSSSFRTFTTGFFTLRFGVAVGPVKSASAGEDAGGRLLVEESSAFRIMHFLE